MYKPEVPDVDSVRRSSRAEMEVVVAVRQSAEMVVNILKIKKKGENVARDELSCNPIFLYEATGAQSKFSLGHQESTKRIPLTFSQLSVLT